MTSTEVDREQDREQYVHSNADTFCLEGQAGLLEEGGAFVLEQWAGFWKEEGPEALQAGWWGWGVGGHTVRVWRTGGSLAPEQGGRSRNHQDDFVASLGPTLGHLSSLQ